jgi:hypothetical protein
VFVCGKFLCKIPLGAVLASGVTVSLIYTVLWCPDILNYSLYNVICLLCGAELGLYNVYTA